MRDAHLTPVMSERHWWQTGVIYEAYVRSFQDTNGDGIGDLAGVRKRLDYLQWLGIDILWLTPIYTSPMVEFGYDIADYVKVDPSFGTMEEFDALLKDAHARKIRVVLDIAPNHTSDQHPWFKESRSSRDNPKADWYLWRDPGPDGGPPNNWLSAFGGKSAWEWEEKRKQFYYHAFMKEQPDLNWRNPEVEKAFYECMRFWLKKGVDGFRIDVIWHLLKDDKFRDNPKNPGYDPGKDPSNDQQRYLYNADRPEVIDLIVRMRDVLQEFDGERLMIGELYHSSDRIMNYYGEKGEGAQVPHNQVLILLPWKADELRDSIEKYLGSLPDHTWPNWVLSNHDKPRIATRAGNQEQARVARMLLLTLKGTPTLYYGDELGMENVPLKPDQIKDPFEKLDPGRGQGRDGQRTPMQWDRSKHAGFTTGEPWLPVADNYRDVNVEAQKDDPESMLSLTRAILELRRKEPALHVGEHRMLLNDGPIIAYRREHEKTGFLIALNLSRDYAELELPHGYKRLLPVLTTVRGGLPREEVRDKLLLEPNEGLILRRL
jgi:alpha-glucosidase